MTSERSSSYRLWRSKAPVRTWSIIGLSVTGLASSAALAIGIILRLRDLLADRSLSQDEAQLALNIINRPFGRLFGQLDFNQAAPEGFLAVQKVVTQALGDSEYALRLFPFVAGTLALVLIFFLARLVVSPLAVPLSVGLFALSEPLIAYTTYNKQYAIDVLMTVVVLLAGFRLNSRPHDRSAGALFAGVGAAAIWLSHASVFVLAGASMAFIVSSLAGRQWRNVLDISVASVVWLASFAIFAITSLEDVEGVQRSLSGTPGAFAGSGPTDSEGLRAGIRTSLGAFRYISGIPRFLERGNDDAGEVIALLVAALCIIGLISISARGLEKALALIAPLGFMLIAWGLGQYPLLGRTQLFLIPIYVLLLGEGLARVAKTPRRPATRAATVVGIALVGAALAAPAVEHLIRSSRFHEMKPVLEYIAREERPGDTVYVYYTAQPQLRYYLECGCAGPRFEAAKKAGLWPLRRGPGGPAQWAPAMTSAPPRLLVGQHPDFDATSLGTQFNALRGRPRVWALIPELEESARIDVLNELDRAGKRRATFAVGDVRDFASAAVVYLYDMRRSSAPK